MYFYSQKAKYEEMLKDAKQKCDEETKTVSILLLHPPSFYLFVFVVVVFLHKIIIGQKKKNKYQEWIVFWA